MACEDTTTRCLVLKRIDPDASQRRRIVQALALKYNEDCEYIERLLTFFSGSFYGLPTAEQKELLEKHLQNKAEAQRRERMSKNRYGNLTLITGRSNDNG